MLAAVIPIAYSKSYLTSVYILFLLAVINFYLRFRKSSPPLRAGGKFAVSLMSIFILVFLFYALANLAGDQLSRRLTPSFAAVFMVCMNLIMPVITTGIALAGYSFFAARSKGYHRGH